jgi:hypothetical protein
MGHENMPWPENHVPAEAASAAGQQDHEVMPTLDIPGCRNPD